MEINFEKKYLQELYEDGRTTDKKHRFQPQVVAKYQKTVAIINKTIMSKYVCARPIHPGEVLKDEIEYRGISQNKLAAQMGISYKMLNHILNEHRPVSTQTALLFEAALGIPADSLIRLQTDYNLQVVNRDKSFANRLAEIRKMVASAAAF